MGVASKDWAPSVPPAPLSGKSMAWVLGQCWISAAHYSTPLTPTCCPCATVLHLQKNIAHSLS